MARSLPSAWSTEAAKTFGKPIMLVKLEGLQDTPLYVCTGQDSFSFDSDTYSAELISIEGPIGAVLDWRGGLGTFDPITVTITQQRETLSGTGEENAHDRFQDTWGYMTHDATNRKAEPSLIYRDSGTCSIIIVWDDGTPVVAESIEPFTGVISDAEYRDHGPLTIVLRPARRTYLERTFLAQLGNEPSGDENYSTTISRTLHAPSQFEGVPILYGHHTHAKALVVHATGTNDDTEVSGPVLCMSDVRWTCLTGAATGPTSMRVWDPKLENDAIAQAASIENSGSVTLDQWEWANYIGSGTLPETNIATDGLFLVGTDNGKASGGELINGSWCIVRHGPYELSAFDEDSQTVSNVEDFYYWNSSTYMTVNGTKASPWIRYFKGPFPTASLNGKPYAVELQCKYAHVQGAGGTFYNTRGRVVPSSGSATNFTNFSTFATWEDTTADFDNVSDFAGSDVQLYAYIPQESWGAFGDGYIQFGIYDEGSNSYPDDTNFYSARVWLWELQRVEDLAGKLMIDCEGIKDGTYTGGAGTQVEVPSDIFYHFVEEVAGETGRVDTTAVATAYSGMNSDSIDFGVNLIDPDETVGDVLDKLAMQSMSWVVPGDSGTEKIIYRPGLSLNYADAADPFTESDIIKGSFSSSLTPENEVYCGIDFYWNYNIGGGKYNGGPWTIRPTDHPQDTNLSSDASVFTAIADEVQKQTNRVLTMKADYINEATIAQKVCKWYFQQHMRRRQIITFATFPERGAELEPGDVIAVRHPMVRKYSYGNSLAINHTTRVCDKEYSGSSGGGGYLYWPEYPSVSEPALVEHANDILVITGGGVNDGSWRITSVTDNDTFTLDSNHTLSDQSGLGEPWYVMPAYIVLAAPFAFNKDLGLHVQVTAVEFPILRAGATTF